MRTTTGKKLAAVWKHPDSRIKVVAYTRNDIPRVLTEYWGYSSDSYRVEEWSRISGLWSEIEGIIE